MDLSVSLKAVLKILPLTVTTARAVDKASKEIVAVKRMRRDEEREGISPYVLREIGILFSLKHENIVLLKEVVIGADLKYLFLVMEYCEHDLAELLDFKKSPFTVSEVKCIMIQLLTGLKFLHSNFIVHRDLKVSVPIKKLFFSSSFFFFTEFQLVPD